MYMSPCGDIQLNADSFEVAFDTSFESLQILRAKMLRFCKENSRDFLPVFDVVVDDIPGQGKMVLKADIKWVFGTAMWLWR